MDVKCSHTQPIGGSDNEDTFSSGERVFAEEVNGKKQLTLEPCLACFWDVIKNWHNILEVIKISLN